MRSPRRAFLFGAALAFVVGLSPACSSKTPGQTYLEYHGAAVKAQKAEDLLPYLPKDDRDKLAQAPPKAKEFFFGMRQDMEKGCVGEPKVVSETVEGDKATLQLESVFDYTQFGQGQKPAEARITLVKESDGWKVTGPPNWAMK